MERRMTAANGKARLRGADGAAVAVFVVAVVVALPLYLVRGHDQWFFLDDWDFLVTRQLTSVHDLLAPHNEHWSTLPIIVYRVLWRLVGLRSYVPYQLVLVPLHLTAAVLLRRVMRRAGVGSWVATAAAGLFVFLGSGRQDIVWAFQIGFVGSLVCGLAQLLWVDHDGPVDRRDAVGLGFGVVGLLCSGVAVTMTVVVGVAVLIRRGLRPALLQTVPLGALYGTWYITYGHDGHAQETQQLRRLGLHVQLGRPSLLAAACFVGTGFENAFGQIAQVPGVGVLLAALLAVGLVIAWGRIPLQQLRSQAAAPAALLLGSVVFLSVAAYGRAGFGPQFARQSRYVHLVTAMVLPALAVAADAIGASVARADGGRDSAIARRHSRQRRRNNTGCARSRVTRGPPLHARAGGFAVCEAGSPVGSSGTHRRGRSDGGVAPRRNGDGPDSKGWPPLAGGRLDADVDPGSAPLDDSEGRH